MKILITSPIIEFNNYKIDKKIDLRQGLTNTEYWRYVEFDILNNVLKNKRVANWR